MRIINVVTIKDGVVDNIKSFGVFEEQLSQEVVEQAEKEFIKQAKVLGFNGDEDDEEAIVDDGYYYNQVMNSENSSVCLSWSDI